MLLRILIIIALVLAAAIATTAAIAVAPQRGAMLHKGKVWQTTDAKFSVNVADAR